jgi:hypothetical protein
VDLIVDRLCNLPKHLLKRMKAHWQQPEPFGKYSVSEVEALSVLSWMKRGENLECIMHTQRDKLTKRLERKDIWSEIWRTCDDRGHTLNVPKGALDEARTLCKALIECVGLMLEPSLVPNARWNTVTIV